MRSVSWVWAQSRSRLGTFTDGVSDEYPVSSLEMRRMTSSLCYENTINSTLRANLKNRGLAAGRLANLPGHSYLLRKTCVVGLFSF